MRRRVQTERRGAAIVEFAVLLPFLLYLVVVAVDWARLMYFSQCVNDCARAGAIYESDAEYQMRMRPRYPTYVEAARAESQTLSPAPTVERTITYNSSTGRPEWVTVTVSMPFNTITNFPGVPTSSTIRRAVEMKIAPMATR